MDDMQFLALAIWRECLPENPNLQWSELFPNEQHVALRMARAAVVEIASILRNARQPSNLLELTASKIAEAA